MKELLQKRDQLRAALKAFKDKLQAGESLSAEEQAELDAKAEELQQVLAKIETQKASLAKLEELTQVVEEEDFTPVASPAAIVQAPQQLKALSGKKEFSDPEDFLLSALGYRASDQRLVWRPKYDDGSTGYRSEQRFDTGSKGGFLIPTQIYSQIMELAETPDIVRPRAMIIPAGSPPDAEWTMNALDQRSVNNTNNIDAGVVVHWTEEGGLKPETDYDLRQITWRPKEVCGYVSVTDKQRRNAQATVAYVRMLLPRAVRSAEADAFLNGNGVGRPAGVIGENATYGVPRATANNITYDDILAMVARFAGNKSRAAWFYSPDAYQELLALTDGGGGSRNLIRPDGEGTERIFGFPLVESERSPALGTKGDLFLADFGYYIIKDGSGPMIEEGFVTGDWERNKSSVKITWNTDGHSWLTEPIRRQSNYEKSPFVALDVPSGS